MQPVKLALENAWIRLNETIHLYVVTSHSNGRFWMNGSFSPRFSKLSHSCTRELIHHSEAESHYPVNIFIYDYKPYTNSVFGWIVVLQPISLKVSKFRFVNNLVNFLLFRTKCVNARRCFQTKIISQGGNWTLRTVKCIRKPWSIL